MKRSKTKIIFLLFIISLLFLPLYLQILSINNSILLEKNIRTSAEQAVVNRELEWMSNRDFFLPLPYFWKSYEQGDTSDVSATITGGIFGTGNLIIGGDQRTYSDISGTPQSGDWTAVNNSVIQLDPTGYGIDSYGCWASNYWSDPNLPEQLVSIHWDHNITLPVDMSDYTITSVSLSTTINASVQTNSATNGLEAGNDNPSYYSTKDFIRFYVLVSDIYKNEEHEIAYYQTTDLGQDSPSIPDLADTFLETISTESILYHMTSVLDADPNHNTFTVSLGILILSEDNYGSDTDQCDSLRIKDFDFSFTYIKKMNQLTTVSLRQDGSKISDVKLNKSNNIHIEDATLKFSYRISESWVTSESPNSELRMYINDVQYTETINLDTMTTGWVLAKGGIGYDVTSLISPAADYVNLSLQLYIGDNFGLNRPFTIYIDDVSLYIKFQEIGVIPPQEPGIDWTPWIIALIIGIAAALSGLIAYILYFQYPVIVRKVRALRRKIKKGKYVKNPVQVENRENLMRKRMKVQMEVLRIEPRVEKASLPLKR
ncbi:MAG: hypothetical protein ACFFBP_07475 [Promethearchaeota archaeon]